MFLDTGIGSSAYTTIENSMINSILSDKAEERRILFEEAAGIGKYKERRKESLRQLDRTQAGPSADQRQGAGSGPPGAHARAPRGKGQPIQALFHRPKVARSGIREQTVCRLHRHADRRERRNSTNAKKSGRPSGPRSQRPRQPSRKCGFQRSNRKRISKSLRKHVAEANETIIGLDRDMSVAKERMANVRENVARSDRERLSLDEHIESATELRMQVEKGVIEHASELDGFKEKVGRARQELSSIDERVTAHRREADRASSEQLEVINAIGEQKNTVSRSQQTRQQHGAHRARRKRIADIANKTRRVPRGPGTSAGRQLESAHESHRNLSASREALLVRIEKEDRQYQSLVEREKRLEAQIDACKSLRTFLEGLDAAFEGYESGVRAVLTKKLPGAEGIVADLVRVPNKSLLGLVERILGQAIQTLVFRTDADLKNAVAFLNAEKAGSARMVSMERLKLLSFDAPCSHPSVEPLRKFVQTADEYSCVADYLFCNTYLTATADEAFERSVRDGEQGLCVQRRRGVPRKRVRTRRRSQETAGRNSPA